MGYQSLRVLFDDIKNCRKCDLCQTRRNVVIGEGSLKAEVMFVGEAPGAREDLTGRPFVGAAGQLLDKQLRAIGLERSDVYIANVLKCRPPGNRDPKEAEIAACIDYLRGQTAFIKPRVIVCLGRISAGVILKRPISVTREHGHIFNVGNFVIMPTFHPAALLRNDYLLPEAAQDFSAIRDILDERQI